MAVAVEVEESLAAKFPVLLRMNAPGFPWPGPLEEMADQAVARLIGLQTTQDRHPA